MSYLNLPNKITIGRILLIPVFMVFLLAHIDYGQWLAAGVFIIAAASDGLDGYLARLHGRITVFGQFLDPLADKLLISGALISLVELGELSAWIAMLIIGREFAVTALRLVAADRGEVIAAGSLGKAKTFMQIIAIVAFILPVNDISGGLQPYYPAFKWTLMSIAVFLTVYSGLDYFRKAKVRLNGEA